MPWMLAAAAAAPVLGGLAGNLFSQGDKDKALDLQKQALQGIMNVNTPDINAMKLALQQYQSAGQLNPEMVGTIDQNNSELKNISTDPRLKLAQMQALQTLQKVGQGGLRPEDQAALAQIRNSTEADERGREGSILQEMQQRGQGGSGAELAQKLISSQGAANRANMSGLNVGAQANQAALQAILNSGTLGSQIQAQDFNQQAQIGNAQDVINRYNAMNRQQIMGQNTAVQNAAQAQNLSNKQNLMNQNTNLGNYQQQYNNNLTQQDYNNKLGKASAQAGAQNGMANTYNQQAGQTQQIFGGLGQAAGQGAAAGAQYSQNQDYMNILKNKYGSAPNAEDEEGSYNYPSNLQASVNKVR